jgi:hypothetical protein
MRQLRYLALAVAASVLALVVSRARPARIVAAQVTSATPSSPPVAHVSLVYSRGLPPASVIVDVLDEAGEPLGSVTVPGDRMLLEVTVSRPAAGYQVVTTAYHRLPWGVRRVSNEY